MLRVQQVRLSLPFSLPAREFAWFIGGRVSVVWFAGFLRLLYSSLVGYLVGVITVRSSFFGGLILNVFVLDLHFLSQISPCFSYKYVLNLVCFECFDIFLGRHKATKHNLKAHIKPNVRTT